MCNIRFFRKVIERSHELVDIISMELTQHTTGLQDMQCTSVNPSNHEQQQMDDVVPTSSVTLSGMPNHCQDSLDQVRHQGAGHQINFAVAACAIEETKNKKKREIL